MEFMEKVKAALEPVDGEKAFGDGRVVITRNVQTKDTGFLHMQNVTENFLEELTGALCMADADFQLSRVAQVKIDGGFALTVTATGVREEVFSG